MRTSGIVAAALLLPSSLALPNFNGFELDERGTNAEDPQKAKYRAEQVKKSFLFAWNGYVKYAFPNDELHPVSNTFSNSRNGWGASAIDALSTACVMELKSVVNFILNYVPKIDYSKSYQNEQVSLFETTIRYLGGMLSGYDLLSGPLASLVDDKKKLNALLAQSKNLADNLSFAFNTKTGVPSNNLYFNNKSTDGSITNGLATIGTLVLEWTRLSDLTGDKKYGELAAKGEQYLLNPKPRYNEPWPGLLGTNVYISNGTFQDASGGWVGGDDSFYEYLIKMYVYDSSKYNTYKDRWVLAADSSIKHLKSHPVSRPDITFMAAYKNKTLQLYSEHLACFAGGNFILGGLVLNERKYTDYGLALTAGCHDTYSSDASGIGPEVFAWDKGGVPHNQKAFYKKSGFYVTDSLYDLRPEVLESYYYAYSATGDTKYQDWSWEGFKSIVKACKANSGFSAIDSVNKTNGGTKDDFQESFLFAELMKYAYLIHSPDAIYDVNHKGKNTFVFNTEAHPLRVKGKPI